MVILSSIFVRECYPAFRGILLLLDLPSLSSLSFTNHALYSLINSDHFLFLQFFKREWNLAFHNSFLDIKRREKPFRNLSLSSLAKHFHSCLSSFSPSRFDADHLKSTRLSLPSSFKKPSLVAFFIKSKLVFVNLLQQCSVFVSFFLTNGIGGIHPFF